MVRQPTLEGARIRLRPLAPEDWDGLFAVAADPLIWSVHPAHDRWREPVFRRFFDDGLASGGGLVIIDKADERIIGFSRYDNHDPVAERIEIGWTFLGRDYWGGSYNRELKTLMVEHAFRFVRVARFIVGEGNLRSRRALEKIGAVLTDHVEDRVMAGQRVRHLAYELGRPA